MYLIKRETLLIAVFLSVCLFTTSFQAINRMQSSRGISNMLLSTPIDTEIMPTYTSNSITTKWKTKIPQLDRNDPIYKLCKRAPLATGLVSDTVSEIVANMRTVGRGSALIFEKHGKFAGIFTEHDFISLKLDASTTIVSEVMTKAEEITIAYSDESLITCREKMVTNELRRLPIFDRKNQPIGVVSLSLIDVAIQKSDFLLSTANLYGQNIVEVEEQSRSLANSLALKGNGSQDASRVGFVVACTLLLAAILQGDFVHEHQQGALIVTFLLGYIGIVFETFFEFNKAAIALLMSTALWVIYAGTSGNTGVANPEAMHLLSEKVSEVSEVVFFLLGAMTIVEIVDSHQGFKVVTDRIKSTDKRSLMWLIGFMTFFMSAVLDNLTTTLVMVSLIRQILSDPEDRKLFGAMIVIAANAGGAWTPIGDVTTTMLWINGQISAIPTITGLFLPSVVSVILSIGLLQNSIPKNEVVDESTRVETQLAPRGSLVFGAGIASLLSVPLFKSLTGLPPYLGMLAGLGVMWTLTDAIHAGEEDRKTLMAPAALQKIDTSGVLFFLGILLAVGALDSSGILRSVAEYLDVTFTDRSMIAAIIGIVSAVIDNVPLVAATMGM